MNWDGRQSVVDALGSYLSDKEAAENTEVVWSIIEQAMKYSNEHSATLDPQKSLYNFFEEAVEKLYLDDQEAEAKKKRRTILQMSEMWGAFVGTEIQKQSLKFFWMEECIDGENLFVAGTYKKVLEKVAAPAEQAGIRFKCKVKKLISHSGNEADPSVTVEFEGPSGAQRETFDEVVMTAPLGWLKTNLDAFEPSLPPRLQEGIGAIGYGHLDKVSAQHQHYFYSITDKIRSTSPSRLRSGIHPHPLPPPPNRDASPPPQPPRPSPTFLQQPPQSTNSAPPTPPWTPRTTQALHPSSRPLTPLQQTLRTGIKKPSTSPRCPATPHTQPCSSTRMARLANTLPTS